MRSWMAAVFLTGLILGLIAGYAVAPRTYHPETFREGLWTITTSDGRVFRHARIRSSDCAFGLVLQQGSGPEIHVREYSTAQRDY